MDRWDRKVDFQGAGWGDWVDEVVAIVRTSWARRWVVVLEAMVAVVGVYRVFVYKWLISYSIRRQYSMHTFSM